VAAILAEERRFAFGSSEWNAKQGVTNELRPQKRRRQAGCGGIVKSLHAIINGDGGSAGFAGNASAHQQHDGHGVVEARGLPAEAFGEFAEEGRADADDDGLANMVEYVLDTDPSNGTSENLPTAQLSPGGENLIFTFTRLKEAGTAGFVSNVEYSETLQNGSWQTATGPMTNITDNGLTETVTVTIPVPSGADSVFARLTVTAP
jgi:hypothetical protein